MIIQNEQKEWSLRSQDIDRYLPFIQSQEVFVCVLLWIYTPNEKTCAWNDLLEEHWRNWIMPADKYFNSAREPRSVTEICMKRDLWFVSHAEPN